MAYLNSSQIFHFCWTPSWFSLFRPTAELEHSYNLTIYKAKSPHWLRWESAQLTWFNISLLYDCKKAANKGTIYLKNYPSFSITISENGGLTLKPQCLVAWHYTHVGSSCYTGSLTLKPQCLVACHYTHVGSSCYTGSLTLKPPCLVTCHYTHVGSSYYTGGLEILLISQVRFSAFSPSTSVIFSYSIRLRIIYTMLSFMS